ncbi:Polyamine aminopropyltransferase [uncultured archaeon]|nr:Polyamine aminopropyltransferase [uncultured archaeon]
MAYPILSSESLRMILNAIAEGKSEISVSFDLDFSAKKEKLKLSENGIIFNGKEVEVPKIRDDDKSCYLILEDVFEKVQYSSGGGVYKLIPTSFRPILQISGTSMHKQSFIERIEKDKLFGRILDSGTGLGYTAIAASKTASKIITIEIDEMVREIQKINPYSQELFDNKRVELVHGDLVEEIKKFRNMEFNFIILDGGTPRSSGEFFSQENYNQAFRVLKFGGRLYHYVPNYHTNRGVDFAARISSYLKKAGFKKVVRDEEGSYLVAWK